MSGKKCPKNSPFYQVLKGQKGRFASPENRQFVSCFSGQKIT
jgi:hypothetical protein